MLSEARLTGVQGREIDALSQAFFRIVQVGGETRVTLYTPKDPEQAREIRSRPVAPELLEQEGELAEYRHGRDFEPHGNPRELRNEFLLCFDDPLVAAQEAIFEDVKPVSRQKAAYISPLSYMNAVKKRRAQVRLLTS